MPSHHMSLYWKARTKARIIRDERIGKKNHQAGKFDECIKKVESNSLLMPIMLHNPTATLLDQIITWFKDKGCTMISQDEVIEAFYHKKRLPDRPVWLTFDDGWKDNITQCLPVLEKQQAPATIFLSTQCVEMGFFFREISLYNPRMITGGHDKEKLTYSEFRGLIDKLRNHPKISKYTSSMITVDMVKKYANHPLISFENHSHTHALPKEVTKEEYEWEIQESQTCIEKWTGRRGRVFCYPNGEATSLTSEIINNEFEMATLVKGKPYPYLNADPHSITRCSCPDQGTLYGALLRIFSGFSL